MTLNEACAAAVRVSKEHQCTVYVNAQVRVDGTGVVQPINWYTTDWFNSDSSVRGYTNGLEFAL